MEPPNPSADSGDGEDIISSLPDSILCHILSNLPTKYAIGTSILSSKWRHLFPSIPDLRIDIDDTLLLHPPDPADGDPNQSIRNTHFVNFVDRLFNVTLRDVSRLRYICINFSQNYGNATVKELIAAASRFEVLYLYIEFTVPGCGISFETLSGFRSILLLTLSQECPINVPKSLSFPNLTRLFLHGATFFQCDGLERALNACPLLEDLSIESCHFPSSDVLHISVPNLKLLMIWYCYHDDDFAVMIDTPTLELFSYHDFVARDYSLIDFNCLQRAHIDLGLNPELPDEDVDDDYGENVAQIITACYNVTHLFLSAPSVSASSDDILPLPIFRNLTELTLGKLNVDGWELLPQFLCCSPNLEALIFEDGIAEYEGCYTKFESSLPASVPVCLSSRLLKINFEIFRGEIDELRLVEYFLRTAGVLKEMKVCFLLDMPGEKILILWDYVKALPRLSENCLVEPIDWDMVMRYKRPTMQNSTS